MFAEISPRYDLLNHTLSLGLDFLWRRAAARELPAGAPLRVADLCCGTGDLAAAVARRLRKTESGTVCHGGPCPAVPVVNRRPHGRTRPAVAHTPNTFDGEKSVPYDDRDFVLGLDFCEPMIRRARDKYGYRRGIEFLVADATHLPLADESFDAVTCGFGLRNVEPLGAALAEMLRILRPGGTMVILELCRPEGRGRSAIFDFYFRRVLPMVGRIVSGHTSAYAYLPASVGRFAGSGELARRLAALGAVEVTSRRLVGGVAALIVGRKQM